MTGFEATDEGASFTVEGPEDAEITIGLLPETEYEVTVGDRVIGTLKSNLGGKLTFSVELDPETESSVKIKKA